MSVSAVNGVITYGAAPPADRYTVPAGKVVVVNFFCASKGFLAGYFSGVLGINGTFGTSIITPTMVGPHCGPFVFNAGDVLTLPTGARGGAPSVGNANPNPDGSVTAITPKLGVIGEAYDAMPNIKVPFSTALLESSTNYTVPAGKIARFMIYNGGLLNSTAGGPPCIAINGVDIAALTNPALFALNMNIPIGPVIAGPGAVLSVTNASAPNPSVVGSAYLNGWLYNTVP